jgi:hypothetical protein
MSVVLPAPLGPTIATRLPMSCKNHRRRSRASEHSMPPTTRGRQIVSAGHHQMSLTCCLHRR